MKFIPNNLSEFGNKVYVNNLSELAIIKFIVKMYVSLVIIKCIVKNLSESGNKIYRNNFL
jgi:hypothetical protein